MKRGVIALMIGGAALVGSGFLHQHVLHLHGYKFGHRSEPMIHAKSEFTFTVHAPMAQAFPLFGPQGERLWAGPHWDPQFVYPKLAQDIEGAVFNIRHGHHDAIWVNTAFDAKAGHAAYAYVIEGKLATRIDVRLTPVSPQTTSVRVMYERTALDPSVEEEIGEMAQADATMGPEWEKAIAEYLGKHESGAPHVPTL
jgi:HAMP domain-containing protein